MAGFMVVPALIVILGFPTRLAIGTSLSIIACISIGGVVGHLQFGRINWPLTASGIGRSLAGMLLGCGSAPGFLRPRWVALRPSSRSRSRSA
ncbi:MAG: sulfite exporter TauE/SafE family protein [Nitrospira sp.]|nr:sulfite exporter TauE/SafE family protein [Nitrospira sp.]